MISFNKFNKLTIRQKIYKIANAIREYECDFKNSKYADTKFKKYVEFFRVDIGDKLSVEANKIISDCIHNVIDERNLDLCFHKLYGLIDVEVREEEFRQRHFDVESKNVKFDTVIILDNIRSPFNVGSIFRTADCLGAGELLLCGITPTPDMPKVQKTSMQTYRYVKWRYFEKTMDAVNDCKENGYKIVAVETLEGAKPLYEIGLKPKSAFVFGNEEFGIDPDIPGICDCSIYIPMIGNKNSMNVSNACSIILFENMKANMNKLK